MALVASSVRRLGVTFCLCLALTASLVINASEASADPSALSAGYWSGLVAHAVNSQRAASRVAPVVVERSLNSAAHAHNLVMAAYGAVSNQLPGESSYGARIARAGYAASPAGENVAETTNWSLTGAYAIQAGMYNETSAADNRHENIVNSSYRYLGVDILIDTAHHRMWLTEVFSSSVVAVPAAVPTTAAMATNMLSAMNSERRDHGLPGLRMNANLINSAHGHNLVMAKYDVMAHLLPGEQSLGYRISLAGYNWQMAAENIGWNSDMTMDGVYYLQRIMYNEVAPNDEHRQIILDPRLRDVGVDIYLDSVHKRIWVTQDFGLTA